MEEIFKEKGQDVVAGWEGVCVCVCVMGMTEKRSLRILAGISE